MPENMVGGQSERYQECQLQATNRYSLAVSKPNALSTDFIWHVTESLNNFPWPLCQYNYNILNS